MSQDVLVVEDKDHVYLRFDDYAVQSIMLKDDPCRLVLYPYQVMMWGTLLCPAPESIGIIGLGGGSLPKWCRKYLPSARVSVAEISADVIAVARKYFFVPADGDRFVVHHEDGADFVDRHTAQLDLLIVDGSCSAGVPDELGTQQFYQRCWRSLRQHGMAVFNLDGGLRSQERIRWISALFAGACWTVTSPYNGQVIVFAQRGGGYVSPMAKPALEARAHALSTRRQLDYTPAAELFSMRFLDAQILAWGRLWHARRGLG